MDPAITPPVRVLPPKKYPSLELISSFLNLYHEKKATNKVNPTKERAVSIYGFLGL
jgi:hypothetical protein